MTTGTRKRKWDLDDQGQLHPSEAKAEVSPEATACLEEREALKYSEGNDIKTTPKEKIESIDLKKSESMTTNSTTTTTSNNITAPSEAVASAKEAASRISAMLAAKEAANKPIEEFEQKPAGPEEQPVVPAKAATVSIASTLGIELGDDKEKKPKAEGRFKLTVDVNDSRHRYYLTKNTTIAEVEAYSGAVLTVRGKYYPERHLATEKDPPICIDIFAGNQALVDKAVARINELKESGPPPPKPLAQLSEKVFAPFDPDTAPNVNVRAKILGPQGSFLRHIQSESGAKAHLRGRGSGYIEIGQREDQLESLHIFLIAERQAEIDYAKRLCEDLFNTVKVEVEAARMVPAMSYVPYGYPGGMMSMPGMVPPGMHHMTGGMIPGMAQMSSTIPPPHMSPMGVAQMQTGTFPPQPYQMGYHHPGYHHPGYGYPVPIPTATTMVATHALPINNTQIINEGQHGTPPPPPLDPKDYHNVPPPMGGGGLYK